MGYSIPGADFTTPAQLKTNVGAETGKMLGNVFASLGPAFIAQQKETAKLTRLKSDYETTTMVENQLIVDTKLAEGEEKIKDKSVYDQWSQEVVARGKAATQAQVNINFGDLSADEKQKELDIISSFNSYNQKSLKQLGKFVADVKAFKDPAQKENGVVIGDLTNGENLLNTITLDANSGVDIKSIYGENATSTRTLNVNGNDNELLSVVNIPVNGTFIKGMNAKNEAFESVLKKGLEEKNIKLSADGKNYIFSRNINMNAYESDEAGPGGFDFFVPLDARINQNQLLKDSNYINDKGEFLPSSFIRSNPTDLESPVSTYQTTENLENKRIGIRSFEILDINQLNNQEAFKKSISIESKTLLKANSQVAAANLANNYGISEIKKYNGKEYTSVQNFFDEAPDEDKLSFVNESVKQSVYSNMFQGVPGSTKAGVSLVRKPVDEDFLKYLNENNILNENGKPYKKGQEVYTRETFVNEAKKKTDSTTANVYKTILNQLNAEGANPEQILSSPIQIKNGNKIGYDKDAKTYLIYGSDGKPTDQELTIDEVKIQLQRGI